MKITHLILILLVSISCKQKKEKQIKVDEKPIVTQTIYEAPKEKFTFDRSEIPVRLIDFIKSTIDSLRVPYDNDYEIDYYESKINTKPPFFSSGNFNGDSLRDYAMVLIKDSTKHYVFAFHDNTNSFETFMIGSGPFISENSDDRLFAIFELRTEKNRILEAIDTVYRIKTDGIGVSDIYNSRSHVQVWNESENNYEGLYFD